MMAEIVSSHLLSCISNNESAVRELGDDTLKKITIDITNKLRRSTTVDWKVRESVRPNCGFWCAAPCNAGSTPDQAIEAVELVLKQVEVLSNGWTQG